MHKRILINVESLDYEDIIEEIHEIMEQYCMTSDEHSPYTEPFDENNLEEGYCNFAAICDWYEIGGIFNNFLYNRKDLWLPMSKGKNIDVYKMETEYIGELEDNYYYYKERLAKDPTTVDFENISNSSSLEEYLSMNKSIWMTIAGIIDDDYYYDQLTDANKWKKQIFDFINKHREQYIVVLDCHE